MTHQIQKPALSPEIVSSIVLKGDISGLNPQQKTEYYMSVCERMGLDPATQPFQLLKLNGKEVMYASKSATEQLSKVHNVSHEIKDRQTIEGVFIVYVRSSQNGRFTDGSGAVSIKGLTGDALANAFMKAETKAKRRGTLSLLGLGMLDETEIETIPGAEKVTLPETPTPKVPAQKIEAKVELAPEEVPPVFQPGPYDPAKHDKLIHEDELCPFGKKSKGKRFGDIGIDDLTSAKQWAEKNAPVKFSTFINRASAHIEARKNAGLPF